MIRTLLIRFFITLLLFNCISTAAQDKRTQYSSFLSNSFFNVNLGYIHYPFSQLQLEPGYEAESIQIPHAAMRVTLFGHQFHKYLSAQVSYMRPVKYVVYSNINGSKRNHLAWMHYGTLTLKSQLPVNQKFSLYGEGGIVITNRSGFEINEAPVVRDANFTTVFLGSGIEYHINKKWDLIAGASYSPGNDRLKQPYTVFASGGFRYTMRPLPQEQAEEYAKNGLIFPKNIIQVGYTTNALGYGVNNFVSRKVPIFWGGDVEIEKGISLHYQRNLFHTRKLFSLNAGAGVSYWKSKKDQTGFYTLSLFPVFNFTVLRTKLADLYLFHSVAGPTYISRDKIDSLDTGNRFTFQDYMGMGVFTGRKRKMNVEININHYSNGNIFPENAGVKIPITFNLGYTF